MENGQRQDGAHRPCRPALAPYLRGARPDLARGRVGIGDRPGAAAGNGTIAAPLHVSAAASHEGRMMTENAQSHRPSNCQSPRQNHRPGRQAGRSPLGRAALAALALGALAGCESDAGRGAGRRGRTGRHGRGRPGRRRAPGAHLDGRVRDAGGGTGVLQRRQFRARRAGGRCPRGLSRPACRRRISEEAVTSAHRARAPPRAPAAPKSRWRRFWSLVGGATADPLLEGTIGILRSPPGAITDAVRQDHPRPAAQSDAELPAAEWRAA